MAELRCLVCNNVNPETAESCQFCGAKLRQPTVPLGPIKVGDAPTPKSTADLEGTLPGWLRDIRSEGAADSPALKPSADLLSGNRKPPSGPLGSKSKAPSPADFLAGLSSAASDDDDEVPDWLASINKAPEAPATPAPSAPASQPPASAPADWMSGLRGEVEPPKPPQPEKTDFGFSASDTWLDETPQKPAPAEETSEDVADWLRTLDQGPGKAPAQPTAPAAPAPNAATPADTGVPDWLSGLEHTSAIPDAPEQAQPAASDWFTPTPAAQAAAPTESARDWLPGVETPATPTPPPAIEPASNLPDWFADLNQPAAETPTASAPIESAPDWLSGLGEATPPVQPAAAVPPSEIPSWLADINQPEPAAPAQPAPAIDMPAWASDLSQPAAPAADRPDWMSSLGAPAAPAEQTPPTDIPDWMRGSTPSAPPAKESEAELPTFEAPAWLSEASSAPAAQEAAFPATEMPVWMSGLAGIESAVPEKTTPPPAQPEPESGLRTKASAFILDESTNAGEAETLLSMDMPDWLSGMAPSETSTPTAAPEMPEASTASEAELPSWVQAMRPVESIMDTAGAADGEGYVEDKGPLAGLRNVLPVVPGLLAVQKPRAYANRLELTESQQAQSNLLEALMAAETTPKALASQKQLGSARVLRWALAALVLLAVIVPVVLNTMGTQTIPTIDSALSFGQTAALHNRIEALQPNDAVLLAFDYEPGLAGELEAVALPVIEHAKLKGARLIAISTAPIGPLLAEHLFDPFQGDQFKAGQQYSNLGYVAGGVSGIASFAARPQQTAPFDNAGAWTTPALAGINAYSDFAAVIVITDNAETGRAWIEQTAAQLNGKPMLMITSAQVEPMLWPYYNSGQIKGMASGLAGGAYYEVLFGPGQIKPARAYWDAFGYSLSLAVAALAIGALVSLVMHFRARNAEGDEA